MQEQKHSIDRMFETAAILTAAQVAKMGSPSPTQIAGAFKEILKALIESEPENAYSVALRNVQDKKSRA